MKKRNILLLFPFVSLLGTIAFIPIVAIAGMRSGIRNPDSTKAISFEVSITTYNVLGKEAKVEPEYAWTERKEAFKQMVLQENNDPDIICFQETSTQAEEIVDMFRGHYGCHVSARSISAKLICWKPEKFELVSYDDDIDVFGTDVSAHNTARYPGHVRLREIKTGKEMLVFNAHLPAGSKLQKGEAQRIRSIGAINLAKYARQKSQETGLPVIVMGDFNNYPTTVIDSYPSPCIIMKQEGLEDVFDKALERTNIAYATTVNRTTSSVKPEQHGKRRIDYIFIHSSNQVAVKRYDVLINFAAESSSLLRKPVPSDHHPVKTVLQINY